MYGYRYKPGSTVLPLPGLDFLAAADKVMERRHHQARNGATVTAELVERDGDDWRSVALPGDESEDGGQ